MLFKDICYFLQKFRRTFSEPLHCTDNGFEMSTQKTNAMGYRRLLKNSYLDFRLTSICLPINSVSAVNKSYLTAKNFCILSSFKSKSRLNTRLYINITRKHWVFFIRVNVFKFLSIHTSLSTDFVQYLRCDVQWKVIFAIALHLLFGHPLQEEIRSL